MLKRNRTTFIILICLLAAATYFYLSQKQATFNEAESVFSVKNTSEINKIEFRNHDSSLIITNENRKWRVNNSFTAKPELIKLCLDVFSGIEIKSALSKKDREKVKSTLLKHGTEVKVFINNELKLHFYVIAHVQTQTVYMMLANTKKPYLVKLPGFEGNFTALFKMPEHAWRDNALLRLLPSEIASVQVEQVANPKQSFEIFINKNNQFLLRRLKEKNLLQANKEAAEAYLMCFKSVSLVGYVSNITCMADSLKKCKPLFNVSVLDKMGNSIQFSTYTKMYKSKPQEAKALETDLNVCYVLVNGSVTALAKYVEIDPITRDLDFFLK